MSFTADLLTVVVTSYVGQIWLKGLMFFTNGREWGVLVPNSTTQTPATDMLYNIDDFLWARPLVVSVGVLYNMSVAGVRVVEFGT